VFTPCYGEAGERVWGCEGEGGGRVFTPCHAHLSEYARRGAVGGLAASSFARENKWHNVGGHGSRAVLLSDRLCSLVPVTVGMFVGFGRHEWRRA